MRPAATMNTIQKTKMTPGFLPAQLFRRIRECLFASRATRETSIVGIVTVGLKVDRISGAF